MGRHGHKIEPSEQVFKVGEMSLHILQDRVVFEHPKTTSTTVLDPNMAPLFRMVANRLDEMAGKRKGCI